MQIVCGWSAVQVLVWEACGETRACLTLREAVDGILGSELGSGIDMPSGRMTLPNTMSGGRMESEPLSRVSRGGI